MMNDTQILESLAPPRFLPRLLQRHAGNIWAEELRATCVDGATRRGRSACLPRGCSTRSRRPCRSDRSRGARRNGDPRSRGQSCLNARRIARRSHGPAFSRSPPPPSDVSHRRVERDALAAAAPISSRGTDRPHAVAAASWNGLSMGSARGERKDGRGTAPPSSRIRRHDRHRAGGRSRLADFCTTIADARSRASGAIDELLLGHRLTAARSERPRRKGGNTVVALSGSARDQPRADVVIAGEQCRREGRDGEHEAATRTQRFRQSQRCGRYRCRSSNGSWPANPLNSGSVRLFDSSSVRL